MTDDRRLSPALPLEIKFDAGNSKEGRFTGHAAVFGNVDSHGDIIQPGAFRDTLKAHKASGTMPAMCWSHDLAEPCGAWLDMREDAEGLAVTGKLTLGTRRGREALALLNDEALGLSIGFILGGPENYRENKHGGRDIHRIRRLVEVSLVSVPSNTRARVRAVKSAEYHDIREFERSLRDGLGLSARQAKRVCAAGYSGLVRDERPTIDRLLAEIQLLRSELLERG